MKYIENQDLNIHLHVTYGLKPRNFNIMKDFYRKLVKTTTTLRKELNVGRKWFPEIDLIVARDEPPFLFCIEFKYYHYLPTTWDVVKDLRRKIIILHVLKKHGVCQDAGIFLLDDGVCRRNNDLCSRVKTVLDDIREVLLLLEYYVSYEELLAMLKLIDNMKAHS